MSDELPVATTTGRWSGVDARPRRLRGRCWGSASFAIMLLMGSPARAQDQPRGYLSAGGNVGLDWNTSESLGTIRMAAGLYIEPKYAADARLALEAAFE